MAREETVHRRVGGRYRLVEPLGRGGMGTVWRAHDELLQRQVAVKQVTLPPELAADERGSARDRVMREARAAARMSHAASVTVFDVLEDDGSVYIVMELLEADTLATKVEQRGPLRPEEAASMALDLVGALEAAHRQGIVHRDVKPSNVMILATGAVKLTDFGIASVKDHPSLTMTGQVLGSPSYMAPEQALGQQSGPEADWWGLGATLYFALEGRPPFDRPGALPTLTAVVNEEPAPPARAGTMAPLLGRLLSKEPSSRPGAAELRKLLRPLAERGIGAYEEPEPERRPGDDPSITAVAPPPQPPAGATASDDTPTSTLLPPPPAPSSPPPSAPAPPPPPTSSPQPPPEPAPRPAPVAPVSTRSHPEREPLAATTRTRPDSQRPADATPGPARQASVRGLAVGALLAVVALLVAVIAWGSGGANDEDRDASTATTAAGDDTTATTTPGTTGGPDSRPATTAATSAEGVPGDWTAYTDPKVGYRISHPPGWQVRPLDATRTDITDPSTGTYLRVDWTDTPGPSPEGAWQAQSKSFGERHQAYEEIRIDPTTFKGFDAAIWEYSYSAGDARLHAVNLGMVTGRYGFALNFQTAEQRWEESQPLFEAFKASFQAPR